MLVETYEATEMNGVEVEDKEECARLAQELGLSGQVSLINDDFGEICPYRKMTKEEAFVYGTILTGKCDVNDYKDGPIPLRVLQVYQHAKSLDMFHAFKVWYAESYEIKDPVLVARVGESMYNDRSFYLLARWGEVLEPLSVLKEFAVKKWREIKKAQYSMAIGKLTQKLNMLDQIGTEAIVEDATRSSYSQEFKDVDI